MFLLYLQFTEPGWGAWEPLVQSLNSPFRTPYIGVEPWGAKRESRDNLHAHAQKSANFSPKLRENHIWQCFWKRAGTGNEFNDAAIISTGAASQIVVCLV